MTTLHLEQLRHLQKLAQQWNYEAAVLEKSPERPFDILSIVMDHEGGQRLELVYYPANADLEGSDFLQLYCQFPFEYSDEGLQKIRQVLPDVNNKMSLGHFSISFNEKKLQFKYVLALPLNTKMDKLFFKDVLEVCMYSPPLFQDVIHAVGAGQLSLEAALRQINPV